MEDKHVLVIVRTIDAPREKVWQMCSDEEQLQKWWGQPSLGVMPYCKSDFRVDGSFHFMVELPEDMVIWGKSIYKEIVEPEKIVFDEYFSDEQGALLDTEEMPKSLITLTLESTTPENGGVGKTILTVRHEGMGVAKHTEAEYTEGWNQSLDKLVAGVKVL